MNREVINNALFKQGIAVALAVAAQLVVVVLGGDASIFGRPKMKAFTGFGEISCNLLRISKLNFGGKVFPWPKNKAIRSCVFFSPIFVSPRLFPEALFGGPLFALADIPDDPGLVILAAWMIQERRRWKNR